MVISETELRARIRPDHGGEIRLQPGDIVTPAARDFLAERGIRVVFSPPESAAYREMGQAPRPGTGGRRYVDLYGVAYAEKPEHMTHLHGDVLVPKNHPRIILRGKLDSLQAAMLQAQLTACKEGLPGVVDDLGELLEFARETLAAEVTGLPLERETLLGLGMDGLRAASHDPSAHCGTGHLVPDYRMGRMAVTLNSLRTAVRETELAAMDAFADSNGVPERPDIILALNRLSSAVYVISCRLLGGHYGKV